MFQESQHKPEACDNCFEDNKDLIWDEDSEMWLCLNCENELLNERKLMKEIEEKNRFWEYFEDREEK